MNYLKGKNVYLSGDIEFDSGANWRDEPKKTLFERFGLSVFDPHADPKNQWTEELTASRQNKDYERMASIARCFVRKDLCMVDRCDLLIAYMPYKVPTTGTTEEVIRSNDSKKPTFIICPQGKENVPAWFYGYMDHSNFFGSWDEFYDHLQEVDNGKHIHNNRWHFCYEII